jgi:predicted dehydrogenase
MGMGWGIVGCGDIANKRVAPAINAQPDSDLIAFFSNTPERAEQMREAHGARRAYSRLEDILADDEIDTIYVASPVYRHCDETLAAAGAGKHVLCEKPMALSVADCERMIATCQATGVHLSVAYYRRWYPKVRKMKELIDQGAIGRPVLASVTIGGWADLPPEGPKHWRTVVSLAGGGALMDVGSHRLDLICYLLGEPAQVCGLVDHVARDDMEVPDTESLLCRMACGVHLHCVSYWGMRQHSDEMVICGTDGKLVATPFDGDTLALHQAEEVVEFHVPPHPTNVHLPLIDDYAGALAAGRAPEFDGHDGLQAQRIMEGCYRSGASGAVVDV